MAKRTGADQNTRERGDTPKTLLRRLEQRFMFDAAGAITAADFLDDTVEIDTSAEVLDSAAKSDVEQLLTDGAGQAGGAGAYPVGYHCGDLGLAGGSTGGGHGVRGLPVDPRAGRGVDFAPAAGDP